MTKQEMYKLFTGELKLKNILLINHAFRSNLGTVVSSPAQVTVKQRVSKISCKKLDLIVELIFEVLCMREGKIYWKSTYTYKLFFGLENEETIRNVLDDDELRSVFEKRQVPQFIWPYLRQELQTDTSKAGIPIFILPPRK